MFYMVYLKDDRQDKRYRVINPKTSCYIDRLVYAPRFTEDDLTALKAWVDSITDDKLHLQIRLAGTSRVVYNKN